MIKLSGELRQDLYDTFSRFKDPLEAQRCTWEAVENSGYKGGLRIRISGLPLTSCMTAGKLLKLLVPKFTSL